MGDGAQGALHWRSQWHTTYRANGDAEAASERVRGDQTIHADDLQVGNANLAERAEFVVVPAFVGRAGDEPVAAVVGQDHAVLF